MGASLSQLYTCKIWLTDLTDTIAYLALYHEMNVLPMNVRCVTHLMYTWSAKMKHLTNCQIACTVYYTLTFQEGTSKKTPCMTNSINVTHLQR